MNFNTLYPKFPFSLPMLLDGATGTALMKAGMPTGICPEKWILENPETILTIQADYIKSGSDAVLAPTFGANRAVLSRYGLAEKTEEMNRSLASLSRKAAGEKLVAGDLSPTGKMLAPIGDTTLDELIGIYKEQAKALDDTVDFYMLETNMGLASTRAAVLAVKEVSVKPIFVTMTVTESGKTMYGDDPECALLTLAELGISAFGLNCSTGPKEMKTILEPLFPMSYSLGIPLIAKPNAGAPKSDGSHEHLPPEVFAEIGSEMLKSGIAILGGCCGTDDKVIDALHRMREKFTEAPDIPETIDTKSIAATARISVIVDVNELPEPLAADEDLVDNADEMADDYDFIYLRLETEDDVNTVLEAVPFFYSLPLAVCGDENAIAILKKYYCGKIAVIADNA
ncbi:MAG: homocysteine S-methyltransferase family protein [Clostridia bacterium]|nr:homocysteine S-methyltransferase family protein [Clostridia bacterium]